MSTNRSMSRGATGDFGSRSGTANFSEGGSTFASDSSRTSTVGSLLPLALSVLLSISD